MKSALPKLTWSSMNGSRTTLAVVGVLVWSTAAAAQSTSQPPVLPSFELRVDEIMNLVYHLDCLPQGPECAFQTLWKEQLGWTPKDDAALARRQSIRDRYSWRVGIDVELDDGPLMFDAPRAVELRKKLILAAAGAKDIAAYRARLELVLTPTDAAELAAIAESFLPRFRRFFADVRPRLRKVARDLGKYFAHPSVRRIVGEAMAFYEVPASEPRRLDIQLIALPPRWTGATRGEQVEHVSTVEIPRHVVPAGQPETYQRQREHFQPRWDHVSPPVPRSIQVPSGTARAPSAASPGWTAPASSRAASGSYTASQARENPPPRKCVCIAASPGPKAAALQPRRCNASPFRTLVPNR